jgi:uncharacterized protein (TIGR02646 family)
MIFVERGASPRSLDGSGSTGDQEREDAAEFFSDPENAKAKFEFEAYKEDDVVPALQAMFGDKCAYCETSYAAAQPPDTEHYRPKSRIKTEDGTTIWPGYHWLAASWDNLLPTCIKCNRSHTHDFPSGPRVTGKADHFPLVDEDKRARAPAEAVGEEPLLLDPTRDDPEEHLEFGEEGVIMAAERRGDISPRGLKTIEIVGLDRKELTDARAAHLRIVDGLIVRFERAIERAGEYPDDPRIQADLDREVEDLRKLTAASTPYTAMAVQRIRPVFETAGLDLLTPKHALAESEARSHLRQARA